MYEMTISALKGVYCASCGQVNLDPRLERCPDCGSGELLGVLGVKVPGAALTELTFSYGVSQNGNGHE